MKNKVDGGRVPESREVFIFPLCALTWIASDAALAHSGYSDDLFGYWYPALSSYSGSREL